MDRLETIVDMIKFENCVADIGCDHGYVGLELFKREKINRLIATDVSKQCLEKSNKLFERLDYNYEGRVGDGLKPLDYNEADTVIIAGMGGELIKNIVTDELKKTRSIKKFIIQPMTEPEKVREIFFEIGFNRTRDLIVKEKKHYYFIMQFELKGEPESREDFMYTKLLKEQPLFKDYIEHEINKREQIINQIKKNSDDENKTIEKLESEIRGLREIEN